MNKSTECGINQELWLEFVENELDPSLKKDLDLHKKTCGVCRRTFQEYKLVQRTLKTNVKNFPADNDFARMEQKIMAAVEKTYMEPIVKAGWSQVRVVTMATAALFILVFGSVFLSPELKRSIHPKYSVSNRNLQFDDVGLSPNISSGEPEVLNEVILSHQDSDDFVLDAAAAKLSRMSERDARTVLDKMK